MATKPTPARPAPSAKAIQAISKVPPRDEPRLPVTLRTDNGFEYHLDLPQSVIEGILDPDVPDVFIEVLCPVRGVRRFLHTAFVKEIDVKGLE